MELSLPSKVTNYEHQVAGHGFSTQVNSDSSPAPQKPQILCCKDDRCVYKPIQSPPKGDREVEFYQSLFDSNGGGDKDCNGDSTRIRQLLAGLRKFVPEFLGVYRNPVTETRYIKLRDLLHGFARPSVMDVKMGARSYEPSASPEKRDLEIAKYVHRHQIGFFVTGLRVWREEEGRYERYSKRYGNEITPSNMRDMLLPPLIGCVPTNHRLRLLRVIMAELEAILAWFSAQDLLHFYASSILLGVECCPEVLGRSGQHVLVRMVDFTHVVPASGGPDEGYVLGLRTLVSLCQASERELADSSEASLPVDS